MNDFEKNAAIMLSLKDTLMKHLNFSEVSDLIADEKLETPKELERVGKGTVGAVYKIERPDGEKAALKVPVSRDTSVREGINQEGKILRKLKGISGVVDLKYQPENVPLLVVEFLDGSSPNDYFANTPDSVEKRTQEIGVVQQILMTIQEAMKKGIFLVDFGYDLNVLVSQSEQGVDAKIFDVGGAFDIDELKSSLAKRLRGKQDNLQRQRQTLEEKQEQYKRNKQGIKDIFSSLSQDEKRNSQNRRTIELINDNSLKSELLTQIDGTPNQTSEMSPELYRVVLRFNNSERSEQLIALKKKVDELDREAQAIEELVDSLSKNPQHLFNHLDQFKKQNTALHPPIKLDLPPEQTTQLEDSVRRITKSVGEFVARTFEVHSQDETQMRELLAQKGFSDQFVDIVIQAIQQKIEDPYQAVQQILEALPKEVKSFTENTNTKYNEKKQEASIKLALSERKKAAVVYLLNGTLNQVTFGSHMVLTVLKLVGVNEKSFDNLQKNLSDNRSKAQWDELKKFFSLAVSSLREEGVETTLELIDNIHKILDEEQLPEQDASYIPRVKLVKNQLLDLMRE